MIPVTATEQNVLEEKFLRSFSAVHFCQKILASIRVNVKNKAVTVTNARQNAYSIIWLVLVTLSYSVYVEYFQREYYHRNVMMYLTCIIGTASQHLTYFLTNCVNRFTQRENNVLIYTMLQNIDRTMHLENNKCYLEFTYRFNIIVLIAITVGFLGGFSANAISVLDKPAYTVFFAFGLLTIYFDMVLGFSMIYFLALRMRHFNGIIKSHINEYKGKVKKEHKSKSLLKKALSIFIPDVRRNNATLAQEKWMECLQHILKCYKIITELYSFSVLFYTLNVLLWTFIVIAAIVVGYRSGLYPLSACITIGMWAGFYYTQLTISAIINDWFVQEVTNMKLNCIRLVSCNYNGPYQKTACEIIKAIHYEKPVFTVYGLFVFDRRLPLEIIGVIASNVLVTIQFVT